MIRWFLAVLLGLSVLGCSGADDEPAEAERPAEQDPTVEEYAAATWEACDDYLGAMFGMAQEDEHLDTGRQDASTDLFKRRAEDIAVLYADYRSSLAEVAVPDDEDLRAAHEEMLGLMDENLEAIRGVAEAQERGDDEQAEALLAKSSRIEEEIAALQSAHGLRPCG